MLPHGHLLVALLPVCAYVLVRDRALPSLPLVGIVFFGSQFPDLIDKPLFHESAIPLGGRIGTHSLPVAIPIGLAVLWYAVYTDRPRAGLVFVFAYGSHIIGDFRRSLFDPNRPFPPELLWPLANPGPKSLRPPWGGPESLFVHLWTVFSITILLLAGLLLIRDIAQQSGFDRGERF